MFIACIHNAYFFFVRDCNVAKIVLSENFGCLKLKGGLIMVGIAQELSSRCIVVGMQCNERLIAAEQAVEKWHAKLIKLTHKSDEGAVTAEYAVVLIAATGFAALLVAILKSDDIRKTLTDVVKKALKIG